MNAFQVTFVIAIALIANCYGDYGAPPASYAADAYAPPASYAADAYAPPPPADYSTDKQVVPYATPKKMNTVVSTSVTYPENKTRVLVYYPRNIVINPKPTNVILKQAPFIVQPAPMVVHQPPAVVARKVYVKNYPQAVKVTPIQVNVVKPAENTYYLKNDDPAYVAPAVYADPPAYAPAEPSYPAPAAYPADPVYPADIPYGAAAPAPAPAPAVEVINGQPVYAVANEDLAAARAGYQLLSDYSPVAPSYNPAPAY